MNAQPLLTEEKVLEFSRSKKNPYFYMLLDYGYYYLCLRSNRRTYALDILGQVSKDSISPQDAKSMLEEGERYFQHVDKALDDYLHKYGVK